MKKNQKNVSWLVIYTTLITTMTPIIIKSLDLAIAVINNGN